MKLKITASFCFSKQVSHIEYYHNSSWFTMPVFWETERRGRDAENRPEMKLKITASFCFSKQVSHIEYYHNSSWLEYGGSPDRAVRLGFTAAFDKFLRENNKYTKNESKILFQDIQDSLVLVTNCFSTIGCFENQTKKSVNSKFTQEAMTAFFKEQLQVWFIENRQEAETNCFSTIGCFENQTKKSVNSKFTQEAMTAFFKEQLQVWFIENRQEADKAAEQVLVNKRARESAEKTKSSVKKKLSGSIDIANRVQKFVDCRSRDNTIRELYIVEGDSAMGSVKQSRNAEFQGIMPAEFQGIMPVRGKILNCLKAEYSKIFASPVITDLMKVLGCGVEVQGKKAKELSSFDLDNLRWNKVVICTDADVDGFQIRTLILTMLYRLCPTLIRDGYVYIAESPLFEITCKDKTWFAYNEQEKTQILKELEGKKVTIQRSKGLGVYIAESPLFEITCKDKTWFAYNEQEKTQILKELEGKKVTIQRSKGLGENDPEMMWMTRAGENPDPQGAGGEKGDHPALQGLG